MKIIGAAELALEMLCKRATTRKAFGKAIAELGGNYDVIAKCRNEIEMCRLLTLKAAYMMDTVGNKEAKSEIAQPKVEVPSMAVRVIERAVQIHGGAGVSQDTPLASLYSSIRYLRIGDGPDHHQYVSIEWSYTNLLRECLAKRQLLHVSELPFR